MNEDSSCYTSEATIFPEETVVEGTLVCGFCDTTFEGRRVLKLKPGENGGRIMDVVCCDSCKDKYGNSYWILISRDRAEYKCSSCNKTAISQQPIKRHIRKEHILKAACKKNCATCGKWFTNENSLNQHVKRHSSKKIACDRCDSKFVTEAELKIHLRSHTKPFACNLCDQRFAQKPLLNNHLRKHSGIKLPRIKYSLCDKTFRKKNELFNFHMATVHEIDVHKIKKFECKLCPERFPNSDTLNAHMRIHTGEKPYACTICNKKYRTSSAKAAHIRTHSTANKKLFKCIHCTRSFINNISLEDHIRRFHTFERPFQCKLCSWNFTAKPTLTRHMLSHTQERTYKCTSCEASFTQSNGLKRHMLIHSKRQSSK